MHLLDSIQSLWQKTDPRLRRKIVIILSFLLVINIVIWVLGFSFSAAHPLLLGLVALAYGLGLRHAVDADHIAAIDNTTRKLMMDGKKPVAVGLFFSLGHSTVVVLLSVLVAISTSFVKHNLPSFQATGTLIGTTVSSLFLLLIGFINLMAFLEILKVFRSVTKHGAEHIELQHEHVHTHGLLSRLFRPVLNAISSSPQMYLVGFLFGLGFDTASEVGLLSISAASGTSGVPIWEIILLPLAFTAGMALVDTLDGILMLGAYGWANIKPVRKLYYNLNITLISVIIALFIGGVEAIQLLSSPFNLRGPLFELINAIDLQQFGYFIILAFIASWAVSIAIYKMKGYDRLV